MDRTSDDFLTFLYEDAKEEEFENIFNILYTGTSENLLLGQQLLKGLYPFLPAKVIQVLVDMIAYADQDCCAACGHPLYIQYNYSAQALANTWDPKRWACQECLVERDDCETWGEIVTECIEALEEWQDLPLKYDYPTFAENYLMLLKAVALVEDTETLDTLVFVDSVYAT